MQNGLLRVVSKALSRHLGTLSPVHVSAVNKLAKLTKRGKGEKKKRRKTGRMEQKETKMENFERGGKVIFLLTYT